MFVPRKDRLILPQRLMMGGVFRGEFFRDGKKFDEVEAHNLVVNSGLNDNLNVYLNGSGQTTSWFMGIFQGNYTPVSTDTAASIAGNSTECSSYTSATRPAWTPAVPSGQAITNSASRATFTFNATVTVYGAFLISSNVIAGTSGILFAAAQFGSSKAVVSGDQLLLTYSFSASSI